MNEIQKEVLKQCLNLPKKFKAKLSNFPDPAHCWIWQGSIDTKNKIKTAKFSFCGVAVTAHRFVWEEIYGERLTQQNIIIQTCGNRLCCNPFHMEKRNKGEEQSRKMKAAWESLHKTNQKLFGKE